MALSSPSALRMNSTLTTPVDGGVGVVEGRVSTGGTTMPG